MDIIYLCANTHSNLKRGSSYILMYRKIKEEEKIGEGRCMNPLGT